MMRLVEADSLEEAHLQHFRASATSEWHEVTIVDQIHIIKLKHRLQ